MKSYTLNNAVPIPVIGFGTWKAENGEIAYQAVLEALKAGYRHIDTAAIYKNEAAILTEIQREVKNGSIILMHDIHAETVNALPKVIDYLKGQGYDFVTVPDLLDSRLKAHQLYYDRDQ